MDAPAAKKQASADASGSPTPTKRLLIGVPKKGRLAERVLGLLNGAGLDHYRAPRLDIAECTRLPVTIVFLPASDIATFVGEGSVDMGITGEDIIAESDVEVKLEMNLGFGKCRLCVQAPVGTVKDVHTLVGKRIATSFPQLTKKHFASLKGELGDAAPESATSIREISGSVEAACGLGLADAVVDLVETGTTMRAAGLEIVDTIMETQTVLISNTKSPHRVMIDKIRTRLEGYQNATKHYLITYNVKRSDLDKAVLITPGHESPTIQELNEDGWISVSSMVLIKEVSDIMDRLKDIGARSILALDIKNCRF